MTRREILRTMGSGFGLMSLNHLLAQNRAPGAGALSVKPPHFPAKAKHVIYLFLNGGVDAGAAPHHRAHHLLHLAQRLDAPLLARMLGISFSTATRWRSS